MLAKSHALGAAYLLYQFTVLGKDSVDQGRVLGPVTASDIVDANPHAEEGVVTRPHLAGTGSSILR